ncbi:hypothetical protein [Dolichospermum sp. UHCC 0259]|nr:hypothetical protein [Dolichospermum sp. UHCC 0259]
MRARSQESGVRSDALSLSKGQESGVRSQEEELEEEKNSLESGKVIGFC